MKIKPCILLKSLDSGTSGEFQKLAELGFTTYLLDSGASQGVSIPDEVDTNQFQSLPVDSDYSDWIPKCTAAGHTHLVVIETLSPDCLEALSSIGQKILDDPWKLIGLHSKDAGNSKKSFFSKALETPGDMDQVLKSENCVYPLFFVQNTKLSKGSKVNHLRLKLTYLQQGHDVVSVPYKGRDQKGIYNWRDRWFLTWFDLYLSFHTQLKVSARPKHASLSLGMGVFWACSPFYGLQTLLIFASAFVFRLNFPMAFLGSQISLPPIYTALVPLELWVGSLLAGVPLTWSHFSLDMAKDHFFIWLLGSLVVGGGLALILGTIGFVFLKQGPSKKVSWNGRLRGGRLGNQFLVFALKHGGLRLGYALLYFVVPYFYFFAPRARRGLGEYWKIINPRQSYWRRQIEIFWHLMRFAQVLMDQAYQAHRDKLVFNIEYNLGNVLKEVTGQSKLLLFSHFGGWGMITQGFARRDYLDSISLIRYRSGDGLQDDIFPRKENGKLNEIFVKPGEPLYPVIHQVLGGGGNLALMGDRPFDHNFELIPFFGKLVPLPITPFRLARTYNTLLCFVFAKKMGLWTYALETTSFKAKEKTLPEAMDFYIQQLQGQIKSSPQQWFNLYPFWSSLPTLPNGELCIPQKYELVNFRGEILGPTLQRLELIQKTSGSPLA